MEKYYYKTEQDDVTCTELCEYSKHIECGEVIDIKIGSLLCKECEHNVAYDVEDKSIKCDVYSSFIELEKLKTNIITLKDENVSHKEYVEFLCEQINKQKEEIERLTYKIDSLEREIIFIEGGR